MKTYGPMARVSRARVKVVAAVAAGVVATMGALTVALSGTEAHAVPAPITGAGDTRRPTTDAPDSEGRPGAEGPEVARQRLARAVASL